MIFGGAQHQEKSNIGPAFRYNLVWLADMFSTISTTKQGFPLQSGLGFQQLQND